MRPSKAVRGLCRLPLHPLAAAFALALAFDAGSPVAAAPAVGQRAPQVLVVGNCDDAGTGSLRDAVNNAGDGDTIDLTQLACSTISLSTGAILIGVSDLTLQGPGSHQLMIQGSGGSGDGLLYDLGGGTLTVDGVDLSFGAKYRSDNAARGGCVYTNGDLTVRDSHIYACGVHSYTYPAAGGALYAQGSVSITHTDISLCGLTTSNTAKGGGIFGGTSVIMTYSSVSGCRNATSYRGYGGGVYSGGDLIVKYSTIADNENNDGEIGDGGGTFSRGGTSIYWSTISGNTAIVGGGVYLSINGGASTALIAESTISGNEAKSAGGIRASMPLHLENSTIAFNRIPRSYTIPFDYAFSAGLSVRASPITIDSTIISNNVGYGDTDDPEDIGGNLPTPIDGSHNLFMSSEQPAPADTIFADPQLEALADNGGLTRTNALRPGSPAIDHGDSGSFDNDQRGPGFPRVLGAAADIGAYEADPDEIFFNGFD